MKWRAIMEKRLMDAQLWSQGDGHLNEQDCTAAWQVLSRLGAPYRYAGRSFDGLFEYLILHPKTGAVIATGKAESTALAMCEAALAGQKVLDRNQTSATS
jgi:hypothetical protein